MSIVTDPTALPIVAATRPLIPVPESVTLMPGALSYPVPPPVRGNAVIAPAVIVGVPTVAV